MASTIAKLVASKLLRVRSVSSSSRFYTTKAFQYFQHGRKDECILRHDHRNVASIQGAIDYAFSPRVSPAGNLASLLNVSDISIGFLHRPHKFPRWSAVENDKALHLLRVMKTYDKESSPNEESDVKESVPKKEFTSGIHEKDVKESVSNKETVGKKDLGPIIDLMRGVKSEPCEYYYHVIDDAEEIASFTASMLGIVARRVSVNANIHVCSVIQDPKAVYIIVGLEAPDTGDLYGGYAYEIFLDDSLYNIRDVEMDLRSELWMINIPKKKGEHTQTIGGNLIFFREMKICKPTV